MIKTHSVTLDSDKCIGCTDCIKRCPTEAIRVRNSKAIITDDRCIDCGMCIRVCNQNAKKAITDPFEVIYQYKYKIAIPAPTLYTQFKNTIDPNMILTALKSMGFDDVLEVARGAEIVSEYTRRFIESHDIKKPIISSACPAIVKLIQIRFPSLINNILPIISPKEAIARYAKKLMMEQGYKEEEIGVFFISPCAAKVTNSRYPQVVEKSYVDGVISIKGIYKDLLEHLGNIVEPEALLTSTKYGIGWASIGGEGKATRIDDYIAVDGIENVIKVLEKMENGKLDVDFIECLACTNGCLGGPLTVENSFVANNRMIKIKNNIAGDILRRTLPLNHIKVSLDWNFELPPKQVLKLDGNIVRALEKMEKMETIFETLPQIDCGSCGAPTCRALAEDIARGEANIEDCVFMLRQKVRYMAEEMVTLAQRLPTSIQKPKEKSDGKREY
ncbi:MAG: 4Fe-4S binding protein [Vallitaleaceae bacterium]|jgi:iron only hydrogenase large subunit-like protein|nr:4Fe-4S binding protein [Vallitaleaceae bacterium]